MPVQTLLPEQTQIRRNEQWLSAWIGEQMMMMNGATGCYLTLSETAGRLWELMAEPVTVASLCHTLGLEYEREPAEIRTAVYSFLEELIREDAVRVEHAAVC